MTPKQAINAERKIKKCGLDLNQKGIKFHLLVFKFRMSGAWAITPEHHKYL